MKVSSKASPYAWESAALAAGAVFAAVAGYKALQRAGRETPVEAPAEVPLSEPPGALQDTHHLDALMLSAPEIDSHPSTHDESWIEVGLTLIENLHAAESRPPLPTAGSSLAFDADLMSGGGSSLPLIWEHGHAAVSLSEAWGETVWFGLQDLPQTQPQLVEKLPPVHEQEGIMGIETAECAYCEVILPSEPITYGAMETANDAYFFPDAVFEESAPPAFHETLTPINLAELELMKALEAAPSPELNVVEPGPAKEGFAQASLEAEPLITFEEADWNAAPVDDFSNAVPASDSQHLVSRIFAIDSPFSSPLPERRSLSTFPKKSAPLGNISHSISFDSRFTPLAPASNELPATGHRWPLIAAAMVMFLIAGLFAVQMLTDGVFASKHLVKSWLHTKSPNNISTSATMPAIGANSQPTEAP